MNIENIVDAIRNNRIRITDHADEEAKADSLSFDEIFFSVLQGEIIEDYPDDTPYPVHSVWAYNRDSRWTVLITVYRPDPNKWIDWRTRRP